MRILATILSFLAAGVVHAANIPYTDVPTGVWYERPVQHFLDAGYLDASQAQFRPDASATRAEFLKLGYAQTRPSHYILWSSLNF